MNEEEDMDSANKNTSWTGFADEFKLPSLRSGIRNDDIIVISDSEGEGGSSCDLPTARKAGSTFVVADMHKICEKNVTPESRGVSKGNRTFYDCDLLTYMSFSGDSRSTKRSKVSESEMTSGFSKLASGNRDGTPDAGLERKETRWECLTCTL